MLSDSVILLNLFLVGRLLIWGNFFQNTNVKGIFWTTKLGDDSKKLLVFAGLHFCYVA